MNNRNSLYLCHALTGEAKREYNKRYYQKNKSYWPEWRAQNATPDRVGAGSGGHWGDGTVTTPKSDSPLGKNEMASYPNPNKTAAANRKTKWLTEYYSKRQGIDPQFADKKYWNAPYSDSNITRKKTAYSKIEQRQQQRHDQLMRTLERNLVAADAKKAREEAERKAKRFPYNVVNAVKNKVNSIKMSLVDTWAQGMKEWKKWLAK